MIDMHTDPPRWAHALLRTVLRPADIDAVPGDLLEEYRDARRPSLGALGADVWYIRQVSSIVWRAVWPFAAVMIALRLSSFPLPGGWNPSLVQAPGVSQLDALTLFSVGYAGARRTGRFVSGIVIAGLTGVVSFPPFFIYAAMRDPNLLRAPFEKPFIAVILLALFAIATGFSVALGMLGAAAGRLAGTPDRVRIREVQRSNDEVSRAKAIRITERVALRASALGVTRTSMCRRRGLLPPGTSR